MHKIEWTALSKQDYDPLGGSQKIFVEKAIARIKESGMQAGQALHGSLSGCRKLKNKKMGLRIVFREANGKIEVIQIVAIGKRDKKEVYTTAENRMKSDQG